MSTSNFKPDFTPAFVLHSCNMLTTRTVLSIRTIFSFKSADNHGCAVVKAQNLCCVTSDWNARRIPLVSVWFLPGLIVSISEPRVQCWPVMF